MRNSPIIHLGVVIGLSIFLALPASAQPRPRALDGRPVVPAAADSLDDAECISGASCYAGLEFTDYGADDVPTSVFGLWWRSLKEDVSLAFTFDAGDKAERQLQFAEERMRMADALLENDSDDPKMQERALEMAERSQHFLTKIEENREKWLDGDDAPRFVRDIATHTATREQILDRMEHRMIAIDGPDSISGTAWGRISDAGWSGRVTDEAWNRFQDLRADTDASGRRLMTALENENVPGAVRNHLGKVKNRIERFSSDREAFNEVQKELLEMRRAGEEGADGALGALRAERQELLQQRGLRLGGGENEWGVRPGTRMEADVEDELTGTGSERDFRPGTRMEADVEDEVFPGAVELRYRILNRLDMRDDSGSFAPRQWFEDDGFFRPNPSGDGFMIQRQP